MGHYYGVDWACKALIGLAVWNTVTRPKMAFWLFIAANFFSVALAFMATPTIWGSAVGDSFFILMHLRNLRCLKKSHSTLGASTTKPRSGNTAG